MRNHNAGRNEVYSPNASAAAISSISPWPYLAIMSLFSFGKRLEPMFAGLWLGLWAGIVCWPALYRLMSERSSPKPIMQKAARDWSALIMVFATIDFFGYGIQPPLPSLGNMLVNWQQNMQIAWWAVAFPAVALVLVVFAVEIVALVDDAPRHGVRLFEIDLEAGGVSEHS